MQAPIFSSNIPLYQLHELVRQCIDVRNINETVTIDSVNRISIISDCKGPSQQDGHDTHKHSEYHQKSQREF